MDLTPQFRLLIYLDLDLFRTWIPSWNKDKIYVRSSSVRLISATNAFPIVICMMVSFYYYDQDPPGFCFLVQIRAFHVYLSLTGVSKYKYEKKNERILVVVVRWRHRANGLLKRQVQDSFLGKIFVCKELLLYNEYINNTH